MKTAIDILRQPLGLPAERLPNRIAKAATAEGLADEGGRPTEGHVRLYDAWARGGAGLLITGGVIIDRDHAPAPGAVLLDRPPDAEMRGRLGAWAKAGRGRGAGFWMQLSHAGRQTPRIVNAAPHAPSAAPIVRGAKDFAPPIEMDPIEIEGLVERFAAAAGWAREAGFTGVQIQGGHGQLLSQFLSGRTNRRADAWGGSLANRARLLLEVMRAVRARVGRDFTVAVKLNGSDHAKGGLTSEESLEVATWLKPAGVDLIEITGGDHEHPAMLNRDFAPRLRLTGMRRSPVEEAYFFEHAVQLRRRLEMPLMVTGGFRTAEAMAQAVTRDVAMIGLARPFCVDPLAAGKLLSGARGVDRWEERLQFGPGLLGRRSPMASIRRLNSHGGVDWFAQQIRRMAHGEAPDTRLSLTEARRLENLIRGSAAPQQKN